MTKAHKLYAASPAAYDAIDLWVPIHNEQRKRYSGLDIPIVRLLMDFRTFVRTMLLRWKIVAGALLACLAGAGALTALQTKHYQASATIMISFSGVTSLTDLFNATEASQKLLSSYAVIAGGSTVAQRAIDELHVPMSAGALASETHVTYTPDSMLFTITVTDTDPNRVAALAGAMANQFTAMAPALGTSTNLGGPADQGTRTTQSSPQQQPPSQPWLPIARATLVEKPGVPSAPVSPAPARNMALGLIAGVLLGVAAALTRDATDRSIRSREQLEQLSVSPSLTELPARRGGTPRFGAESSFDDAMRSLRTRLLRKMGSDGRRVLVTAPFGGEGTTTTAVNLALSFVELGEKVLLIEGNIRRPVIAGLMNVRSKLGLASALADCAAPGDAVHDTPVQNLFVLASQIARDEETLPRSANLPDMLRDLSAHFDRLVIDGPPVLATADTGLLADAVEATVLVVRAGRTTADEVADALHALRSTDTDVVGTVLTHAQVSRHAKAATRTYWRKSNRPKVIGAS
jgi:capsular exopolysaccharide synthesis family protein